MRGRKALTPTGRVLLDARYATRRCASSRRGRLSQGDSLFEHPVAKQFIEPSLRHDLYSTTKKFFQLRDQPARKPGTRIRPHLDQEVDVTLRPGIATRHRAEHPDPVTPCRRASRRICSRFVFTRSTIDPSSIGGSQCTASSFVASNAGCIPPVLSRRVGRRPSLAAPASLGSVHVMQAQQRTHPRVMMRVMYAASQASHAYRPSRMPFCRSSRRSRGRHEHGRRRPWHLEADAAVRLVRLSRSPEAWKGTIAYKA